MKSIFSKATLAGSVAVALGTVATTSEAGIWDYCADRASTCESNAQRDKDQCYEDAKGVARDFHNSGSTRAEVIEQLAMEEERCDYIYNEDMGKCKEQFNAECS
jgi:hypothetical protein